MGLVDGLETVAVAERVGVSVRRLGHWDRLGIVSPSILPARGSGSRRLYAADDLVFLLLVKSVRELGGTLELAEEIVSAVRSAHRNSSDTSGLRVVAGPDSVTYCGTKDSEFRAAVGKGAAVLIFNLDLLSKEAERLAQRPSRPRVEVAELEGAATQVMIVPKAMTFIASAKKFPGFEVSGGSVAKAIEALRKAIEAGKKNEDVEDVDTPAAAIQKSGASAWGGEW